MFLGQNQNVKILANGQFVVNASSGATDRWCGRRQPPGFRLYSCRNPNLGSGGFTSLRMGITSASGGEGDISAIKASGSEYGNLVLNRSAVAVAIGNIAVPNFQLQLSQNSAAKPGGGASAIPSDSRLKHDVQPLQGWLDRLLRLRGVAYQWNNPEEHGNLARPQVGMIAQEVQQVFPEWIGTDQQEFLTLGIRGFEALTVESLLTWTRTPKPSAGGFRGLSGEGLPARTGQRRLRLPDSGQDRSTARERCQAFAAPARCAGEGSGGVDQLERVVLELLVLLPPQARVQHLGRRITTAVESTSHFAVLLGKVHRVLRRRAGDAKPHNASSTNRSLRSASCIHTLLYVG